MPATTATAKRAPDDHAYGEINYIAFDGKFLEFLDHSHEVLLLLRVFY